MSKPSEVRVRRSVRELQKDYEKGNKKPLEDLIRAWKGIKELSPEDPNSFFRLAGYHGEPFIYRPWVDNLSQTDTYLYWGGYCNHGNVLFPTWHRVYILKLEEALQSIVPDVMMPYWDETSKESIKEGIPDILTREKFTFSNAKENGELAGKEIDNPLRSFVLPMMLSDDMNFSFAGDTNHKYAKPKGYETVRYPLSGLVGTQDARQTTKEHNKKYPDPVKNVELLNKNITQWLHGVPPSHPVPEKPAAKFSVYQRYRNCLNAPNYTVFSNTTSSAAWNRGSKDADIVIPLEDPHNDVHLAVGGFDNLAEDKPLITLDKVNVERDKRAEDKTKLVKDIKTWQEFGILTEANGDMGENNTAAMDPIFFFHHCNVDRMFWLWQKKHLCTDELEILKSYPGTSSTDSQGPTPGFPPNTPLGLDTPLQPFIKKQDGMEVPYISKDCINIERQLNYTYSPGSLDEEDVFNDTITLKKHDENIKGFSTKKLVITEINRALFNGSFILRAYAVVEDKVYYLGHHSVLSRRNVVKCANCLTHLEVHAQFPLSNVPSYAVDNDCVDYHIAIQHRNPQLHPDLKFKFEIKD